jgi:hypothetical protein
MDQGEFSLSSRWRDLNVLGKRWQMVLRPRVIFGRASKKIEGTQSLTRIVYPLWSLSSNWGMFFEASHKKHIYRTFLGPELATYDDPATDEVEAVTQEYRLSDTAVRTLASRFFGDSIKHTFSLGHELLVKRPTHLEDRQISRELADAFARDLFPRSERSSALFFGYSFFEPRYVTYRNVEIYDLPEVVAAGPSASLETAIAMRGIGSERNFGRLLLSAGYLFDFEAKSFARLGIKLGARLQEVEGGGAETVDREIGLNWFLAGPVLPFSLRPVLYGSASLRSAVRANTQLRVGGQADLRGYPVGRFLGTSSVVSRVELRSLPRKVLFFHAGYLLFWDAGHAANRVRDLELFHDVGVGIKTLTPQTGQSLLAFYWALPLDNKPDGFPGRISVAFERPLE